MGDLPFNPLLDIAKLSRSAARPVYTDRGASDTLALAIRGGGSMIDGGPRVLGLKADRESAGA